MCSLGVANFEEKQDQALATNSVLSMPGMRHGVDCPCCTPGKSPGTMNQQAAFMGHDTVTAPLSHAVQNEANLIGLNKRADDDLEESCQEKYHKAWRGVMALYILGLRWLPDDVRTKVYVKPLDDGARPNV